MTTDTEQAKSKRQYKNKRKTIDWFRDDYVITAKVLTYVVGRDEGLRGKKLFERVITLFPTVSHVVCGKRVDLAKHIQKSQDRELTVNILGQRFDKMKRYPNENPEKHPVMSPVLREVEKVMELGKLGTRKRERLVA